MRVNLDAARRARDEEKRTPHVIEFGGEEFTLPPMLPIECVIAAAENRFGDMLRSLFGDQHDAFMAHGPDMLDLDAITKELYGFSSAGESQASVASLTSNGDGSRPTSSASTGSLSERLASAPDIAGHGTSET
jgi:hypothetical protein